MHLFGYRGFQCTQVNYNFVKLTVKDKRDPEWFINASPADKWCPSESLSTKQVLRQEIRCLSNTRNLLRQTLCYKIQQANLCGQWGGGGCSLA